MKPFSALIKKEFYHILRDKRTILILLGMPVVQIILFGFAISTEVKNIRTAILAPSIDTDVRQLIDRLDASEYFTVEKIVRVPEELETAFRKNEIDLAVVFPHRFANHLNEEGNQIQIIADATDPNLGVTRSNYAAIILSAAQAGLSGAGPGLSSRTEVNVKLLYNPQMRSAYNFVPGVMGLILMLICALMTSVSIVREKETGTMELLLVSPVKPAFVFLSKIVPYFVLSILNLTTILLLSYFLLDVPVTGSLTSLFAVSLLFIFVSLSLGLLISCVTRTQVAALLASGMILLLPTILLSGMIFPIESMPPILQLISCVIPARWYIDLVRKMMIEGVSVALLMDRIAILLLMATILTGLSSRLFKNRLN